MKDLVRRLERMEATLKLRIEEIPVQQEGETDSAFIQRVIISVLNNVTLAELVSDSNKNEGAI